MKILNPQSATLTNAELYKHLTSKRASVQQTSQTRPAARKSKAPAYEAITREILDYLSPGTTTAGTITTGTGGSTASAGSHLERKADKSFPLPAYAKSYSDAKVEGLVRDLAPFELAKAEVLGIVNLAPKDLASLDALVEEVDERFNLEKQEEILQIIGKWLLR